uniref:C2H2-type domain-containing protein n=1 Tax=Setaria digitata TaxID=48799 RepID=A0A915PYP5_9BILA
MGDSYDEDEGRLMIDDAILDSTHASQTGCAETSSKATTYEKTVELTPSSDDGEFLLKPQQVLRCVESHPVDPEPKPNFYCESGVSKVVQGVHRDDRLKMTIKRTQSPVGSSGQFSYLGEKHGDGPTRSEDISKEEGEIDDEEETGNNLHAQSTAVNVQSETNWSGYQNTSFEGGSTSTNKLRHGGQQQFDHHAVYSTPHSSTRQLAVNIPVSSSVTSPGPPNVTSSVTVEEHNSRVLPASYPPQTQTVPKETQFGEDSSDLNRQKIPGDGFKNTGALSTPSNKARKKKRRASERDEHETCQASPSGTSPSFNTVTSQLGTNSAGVSLAKKRKTNIRDRSTCVSVKSVQTNDGDIDIKVGSTHCLNISVLAKASNYLYYVTNWNGHDLYGVLGDGLPPLQHTYVNRKCGGTSTASNSGSGFDLFSSHDKTNGGSPSKQRLNAKRSNRSSSVCPPNGFPDIKPTGRKGLVGNVGRPSSASTSDVQSVGGDLQDEERSQSPVSWFTSGSNDPISALGSFGIAADNSSSHLRECILSTMYSCPVAGCEHRYDTQSQLAIHYHTHFVKEDGGKAIYVETMGTQTNSVIMKDVAVDTDREITQIPTVSSEVVPEVRNSRNDAKNLHLVSPKPKLSKTLTNHEEQSINELFKVVTQKAEAGSGSAKADNKKVFSVRSPKINAGTSKVYGALLSGSNIINQNEMPTALDAIRKMVTNNSGEIHSREHQSSTVISSSGILPSTSVSSTTPHGGAASPAFSDISDDAPTLEKEVTDKSEERSLDRIKDLVNSTEKAPLEQLSLSIEDEKMVTASKSGIGSSTLLCPVSTPITTSGTTLAVPREGLTCNLGFRRFENTICFVEFALDPSLSGSKKNEMKTQSQANTIGSFSASFMDPSGLRHSSTIPISMPNLSNAPSASVFAQPYFMPFITPVSNAATPGMSQSHTAKHKIHDLKTNPPSLIPFQSKESSSIGQSCSVVTSSNSQSLSQGGTGNVPATKQAVHQQAGGQSGASGNSFASIQPHAPGNSDRSANTQNAPSSALNFMQHQQQQQAYFAQLQQHQQMQYMQRFGAAFPMTGPPNSMNAVAQQAYEQQMAALHASFGYPGIFMPPSFPPK